MGVWQCNDTLTVGIMFNLTPSGASVNKRSFSTVRRECVVKEVTGALVGAAAGHGDF